MWEEDQPQVDHVIFPVAKRIILLAIRDVLVNLGCKLLVTPSYICYCQLLVT